MWPGSPSVNSFFYLLESGFKRCSQKRFLYTFLSLEWWVSCFPHYSCCHAHLCLTWMDCQTLPRDIDSTRPLPHPYHRLYSDPFVGHQKSWCRCLQMLSRNCLQTHYQYFIVLYFGGSLSCDYLTALRIHNWARLCWILNPFSFAILMLKQMPF